MLAMSELKQAESAPDVLRAVARALWKEKHGKEAVCPGDAIPDVDQINAFRLEDATAAECEGRVEEVFRVLPTFGPWVAVPLAGRPWAVSLTSMIRLHQPEQSDKPASGDPLGAGAKSVLYWATAAAVHSIRGPGAKPIQSVSPDRVIRAVNDDWKATEEPPCPICSDLVKAVPDCELCGGTRVGKEPDPPVRHPLAPLVRAWQERALPGEWDDRSTAIIPAPFSIVRDLRSAQGTLFPDGAVQPARQHPRLPGFDDGAEADERLPFGRVVPLMMFDATGTLYESRGQGAPLALRLWIESVTAPALLERGRAVVLETSLRNLVRRLWPNGWTGPGRDGEKLLAALRAIDGARIPWPGSDEGWRAVSVVNPPAIRNPDSPVVLTVLLPPGSERGPLVYRNVLREYGVTSAPLYRLGLATAYLWDRYFTHNGPLPVRVPVVNRDRAGNLLDASGKPVQGNNGKPAHWNHKRAVRTGEFQRNPELSRIPDLRADDLLLAAYPREVVRAMTPGMRRKALHQVREAALDMAARDHAVVHETGARGTPDWRIRIEPPDWHGAPEPPSEPASGNDHPASGNDHPASGND